MSGLTAEHAMSTGRELVGTATQAARIATLEEEAALARELTRAQGDDLESLRRELRTKEFSYKELAASERLAQAELSKATAASQDLEELVSALRDELHTRKLAVLAEKEARSHLGEQATEWQLQLGETKTQLAAAVAAEQKAKEQVVAAEAARSLAEGDAKRMRLDAAASVEAKAAIVQEKAASSERRASELATQLQGAQELVREHAAELATLRESVRAHAAEIESRGERLQALGQLLEASQAERATMSGQLGEATHELWEGAMQQRLRREQAEAVEARLGFLQKETAAKDKRLRTAEAEAGTLRGSMRQQQTVLAEAEQRLQKARVVDGPSLKDELRREQSRRAGAEAKLISIEAQHTALSLGLAEARQAAIDKEQAVVQARSHQLAAELKLADADQRVAAKGRWASVVEAEARATVDRHTTLMDAHSELRATLRKKESALAEAHERERTHAHVSEPLAQQQLHEARQQANALEAAIAGKEERHGTLLQTLTSLRMALTERDARVHQLEEHVLTLESTDLLAAQEAEYTAKEQAKVGTVSVEASELREQELNVRPVASRTDGASCFLAL